MQRIHSIEGIDFEETFSPIVQDGSNQIDLSLCMFQNNQGVSDGCKIKPFLMEN
jgi:hypothetical protein